jgi:hypothetical protein
MANKRYNRNPANQTSFKMEIPGLEEFNYFLQSANIPGLTMAGIATPFQNHQTSVPSNRIDYDELSTSFIVDEDYSNHTQIRKWMHGLGYLDDPIWGQTKNVNLFVLDSNKQPKLKVIYYNAYPTGLGGIPLDSAVNSTEVIVTSLSLRYQYYDIEPVT